MKRVGGLVRGNLVQFVAFSILMAAMFSASKRAALPAMWAIGRFLLPFLIVYLIYRMIRSKVSSAVKKFQDQMMQGIQNGQPNPAAAAGRGGQVIDLCPTCGAVQGVGHKCSK